MLTGALEGLLVRYGYDVMSYTDPLQALQAFESQPHRFDAIITDQTMPEMTGEHLARALRRIRPDIPIILCTGFSHVMDATKALRQGIDAFCMKPIDAQELLEKIEDVLASRRK